MQARRVGRKAITDIYRGFVAIESGQASQTKHAQRSILCQGVRQDRTLQPDMRKCKCRGQGKHKYRQTLRLTHDLPWGGKGLVTLWTSLSLREPSHQEAHLRKWLPMSTTREHLDLLIAAMDPNKSHELPPVVKVTFHGHQTLHR